MNINMDIQQIYINMDIQQIFLNIKSTCNLQQI